MNVHKQTGFSLIEVMVAIAISSILILGVTELFSSSFMSGRNNSELARMQENGRLAMEVIGTDIRFAGLQACMSSMKDIPIDNAVALANDQKSITLRFTDPAHCSSANAALQTVTYSFANNRLYKTKDSGAAQPLLDDVTGSFSLIPDNSTPETANAVIISIEMKSTQNHFAAREFSATYELKNRLIARDSP